MVALRLPFLQIRELGRKYQKGQLGLTGGVINVPADTHRLQSILPRDINETDTVAIALKKRLMYKNAYAYGRICVYTLMKALKRLCITMLYKQENATINDSWIQFFTEIKNQDATDIDSNSDDDDTNTTNEPIKKTLLHAFTETYGVYDL